MFMRSFSVLLCSCTFIVSVIAEIPEPYRSIIDIPFDSHGWFVNERPLENILKRKNPQTVIEIGSWLGCSTRFIASHLEEGALLYAIDTWRGSEEHVGNDHLPYLYSTFLSNIKHARLTDKIVPIRMESLEAAKNLSLRADLIYIDAAHDTVSVKKDIMNWYPHLNGEGVMCGDDWLWESVRKAVVECAQILGKEIYTDNNFWSYSEIKSETNL